MTEKEFAGNLRAPPCLGEALRRGTLVHGGVFTVFHGSHEPFLIQVLPTIAEEME
jgi:hypothetical protein